MATLEDLVSAVNALGANQRDHALRLTAVETELADFRTETRGRFRSVDEQLAEIKDLIIGRRNVL
jgi:hypothetical protein